MKKNILTTLLILFGITFLGGFLRFYKIAANPPSLNGDEISFGYSAYSILKTGRDEFGKFLPLVFKSVGDYKNPVPAYLMLLPIKALGLTDFAVRFPNAFFGTIFIPIFYLFLLYILKDKKLAFVGSFLMAVSAWFIFYSRFAYEPLIGSLFAFLGIWFYMMFLDGKRWFSLLSAFFLVLTMYTSFAQRFFVPLFIGIVVAFNIKKLKGNYKWLALFLFTCLLLVSPLIYSTFFQGAGTRLSMVLISNDIDFSRYVLVKYFDSINDLPLLFIFWLKRYLNYIDFDFLFFNGLHMTTYDIFGLGLLYIFEIPWLILGIFSFIKKQIPHKNIFIIWLLVGIIPDSLTNNQQHGGRLLHIGPILLLITTLGLIEFIKWIKTVNYKYLKFLISSLYGLFIIINLIHAFLVFSVHFPRDRGEYYDEGLKQAVLYIGKHQDDYKEIVFDQRHGVDAPNMVANPFLYVRFYLKYDPKRYQDETKTLGTDIESPYFKFDKYTFRHIEWGDDKFKKGVLFVGSPWNLPEKDLKKGELLKKIYLTNGNAAYFIVSPQ
ncbi:MAG TPA: glycosyltransferase family 39 protein [Patescibacteria group bacterium]|nr:glycosyltransferase family 39 protein [Patescibacteria group bacterium]